MYGVGKQKAGADPDEAVLYDGASGESSSHSAVRVHVGVGSRDLSASQCPSHSRGSAL